VTLLEWSAVCGSQAIKELDHSESGVGSIPTNTKTVWVSGNDGELRRTVNPLSST
jgi:hypothetical protein